MGRGWGTALLALGTTLAIGMPAAHASNDTFAASEAPSLSGDGSGLRLTAIDCSSIGNCVAVGTDGTAAAIDVETDGTWSAVPLTARSGYGATSLVSVSCPAAGACVAVGSSGSQGVIEMQAGTHWTGIQVTGDGGLLTGSAGGSMSSVSCPAVGSCAAVGQATINNTHTGLLDSDAVVADLIPNNPPSVGSQWSAQKAPETYSDAPENAALVGVSCSAPGECRAVGHAIDDSASHNQYALVDDEKNYAWAYGAAAVPADSSGGPAGLTAISCVGSTFVCMAAGYYPEANHGAMPMIQTIDASDHAEVTAGLLPIEDANADLLATSCAADGTCQSVGVAYDSPGDPTYGYGYDGYIVSHTYGAPAAQSAGVVASNTYSPGDANTVQHNETLTATSCASGGWCVAVGSYVDTQDAEAGVIDTRQYDSDGNVVSETDVRAPEPADDVSDDQSRINGADCSDANHCVAVGAYLNDTSSPHGVIETLGGSTAPAPTITHISPRSGPSAGGTKLTITGTSLSHVTAVRFGSESGTKLRVISGSQVSVVAPAHSAGAVDIRVIGDGGAASAVTPADRYTYVAPPVVTGLSPAQGSRRGGTRVTISGHGFTGATRVEFGGKPGSHIKVASATKLSVTTPSHGAGQVDVRVVTAGGISKQHAADHYRFT